jgi:lipopolysaccharide assembly outer membrane protein LptD (OstA)
VPSHYSPILSRLRLRPTRGIDARFDLEYDINYNQFRTYSVASTVRGWRGSFLANWTRRFRLAEDGETPDKTTDFVRGAVDFDLLPRRLNLTAGIDYDFVNEVLLQWRAGLRFEVQCCGVMLELVEFDFNDRKERQFTFSVSLANIGSMGSFLGEQPVGGRRY